MNYFKVWIFIFTLYTVLLTLQSCVLVFTFQQLYSCSLRRTIGCSIHLALENLTVESVFIRWDSSTIVISVLQICTNLPWNWGSHPVCVIYSWGNALGFVCNALQKCLLDTNMLGRRPQQNEKSLQTNIMTVGNGVMCSASSGACCLYSMAHKYETELNKIMEIIYPPQSDF